MTIHSLLRHVGLEVPEIIYVDGREVIDMSHPLQHIIDFMNGSDRVVLARLRSYFSSPGKYCRAEELKEFWDSLTLEDRFYYRNCVETNLI